MKTNKIRPQSYPTSQYTEITENGNSKHYLPKSPKSYNLFSDVKKSSDEKVQKKFVQVKVNSKD